MNLNKVQQYIRENHLFTTSQKILVAISGGADSVSLLRILLSLGYTCEAAHCNFRLRGEESDRDEYFVKQLCKQLHIPLHVTCFNTAQMAKRQRISIEMAARELRYAWFEKLRIEVKADVIAVAHHMDDSVETFLLNLLRGTGINGLRGIRPKNGHIVRPLLCLSRQDIINYLKEIAQPYVTDRTNLQDEYTRNKIRLNLIPLMEEINPSFKATIIKTATHLNEASKVYHKGIAEGANRVCTPNGICITKLLQEPAPEALLFELLYPQGFNASQISDIFHSLHGQSGRIFISPQAQIIKDRNFLLWKSHTENDRKPVLKIEEYIYSPNFTIPKDKTIACIDADKITYPLTLRKWEQGDTFIPFGMKGKKKVSDYLTDHKFSLLQKEQQWVLCSGKDIVWLIGERSDNRFRIDEHTRKVLCIQIIHQKPNDI